METITLEFIAYIGVQVHLCWTWTWLTLCQVRFALPAKEQWGSKDQKFCFEEFFDQIVKAAQSFPDEEKDELLNWWKQYVHTLHVSMLIHLQSSLWYDWWVWQQRWQSYRCPTLQVFLCNFALSWCTQVCRNTPVQTTFSVPWCWQCFCPCCIWPSIPLCRSLTITSSSCWWSRPCEAVYSSSSTTVAAPHSAVSTSSKCKDCSVSPLDEREKEKTKKTKAAKPPSNASQTAKGKGKKPKSTQGRT